mmetsp:Transcript_146267/g.354985  ORF Transcript_146267/g.354985 Transcript_146267/m.354985 type:complete len:198 (-) Transcript_146267:65-658(-)
MLTRIVCLLVAVPAISLRWEPKEPDEASKSPYAPKPINLTQVQLDTERELEKSRLVERALHAAEAAQSESAVSYFYLFDEKIYSCFQGPMSRLMSLKNYLRSWGMQESYLEHKLKINAGSCEDMCMRNGWVDRRSCVRNVHQCRHPEWKVMDKLTHKLAYLAYETNSTLEKMHSMIDSMDIEKTCVPNGTAMFRKHG